MADHTLEDWEGVADSALRLFKVAALFLDRVIPAALRADIVGKDCSNTKSRASTEILGLCKGVVLSSRKIRKPLMTS
jgi:hypothetical protein